MMDYLRVYLLKEGGLLSRGIFLIVFVSLLTRFALLPLIHWQEDLKSDLIQIKNSSESLKQIQSDLKLWQQRQSRLTQVDREIASLDHRASLSPADLQRSLGDAHLEVHQFQVESKGSKPSYHLEISGSLADFATWLKICQDRAPFLHLESYRISPSPSGIDVRDLVLTMGDSR